MTRAVCDGLRVIEMGAGSIGTSFAGMLLADFGARVVKVEPPEGDQLRQDAPSGFLVWNRGKESLVADLRTEAGREELRRLAANADVILEGFGVDVADAWGLGYDVLKSSNPELVYCSIKGFGSTGPYSKLKAYEGLVAAKAGSYSFGDFGFRPGPIFFSAPLASVGVGHMAFAATLAALTARTRTSRGQHIETTMLNGLNPNDYFGMATYQQAQKAAAATGADAGTGTAAAAKSMSMVGASRYSFFVPTQDGRWVIFTQMLPHQAHALSRAVGLAHTIEEPRFATQPHFATAEDAQAWEDAIWEAMAQHPYEYWEKAFLADPDIAFELARFSEEGLDHQQVRHNGEIIRVEDPRLGTIEQVGPVANMHSTPARITRSAPALAENHGAFPDRVPAPELDETLAHPLEGLTIVELGYFYAMPYGSTMTAALGARVIKVEGEKGDPMRVSFGVAETGAAKTMEGKESLAVDLQSEDGRRIVRDLIARADVFVNGFRPGVADRMGLGYEALKEENPNLVYLHAAGYGVDGPLASRPIYAQVAQAVAGSIGRYAGRWLDPELTRGFSTMEAQIVILPRVRGPVDGDANAALGVLSSLALGIYDQRCTGEGQFLSTSMIGGNALSYADDFIRYDGKPPLPRPDDDSHGLSALYRLYPAQSGWVFLAAPKQKEWEALTAALERPDLRDDERFVGPAHRRDHDEDLANILREIFSTRNANDWEGRLAPLGVGCVEATSVSMPEFACTDPILREMGQVVEVEHPLFGSLLRYAPTAKFSETPARVAAGCLAGQHTESILAELGYSGPQVEDLFSRKVAFRPED
jgi:crotonobetainyl-CoA:carnitine CoA-transferase CaiB-like acyl-CoA transferase